MCGRRGEHQAPMALVKRSPKMTANLGLGHDPLTGRHLPLPLGAVHDEEEQIIAVLKEDQASSR